MQMAGQPGEPYISGSQPAFGFTVALTGIMIGAALLTPAIGVLGPLLIDDLGLSRASLGVIASLIPLTGAATAPFSGALVDRFGGRRLSMLLFTSSGLGLALFAVAPNFWLLAFSAVVAGVAMGTGNPTTNALIAKHVARGRQGVIVGVKQTGVQLAAMIVSAAVPVLAVWFGWRVAAGAVVLLVLVLTALVLWQIPAEEKRVSAGGPKAAESTSSRWAPTWWLAGYAFLLGAGSASIVTYIPLFAVETVAFSVPQAGLVATLVAAAAAAARIGWARLAERVQRTTEVLLVIAALSVLGHLLMLLVGTSALILWVAALLLGASSIAWNGVAMLHVVGHAPAGTAGRVTGRIQFAFTFGMFFSPIIFGVTLDALGSYTVPWLLMAAICAAGGLLVWRGRSVIVASTAEPV
jgi:predicted MFS family arabinose efflux permease